MTGATLVTSSGYLTDLPAPAADIESSRRHAGSFRAGADARVHCAERERHLLDLTCWASCHRRRFGDQARADDRLPRPAAL